MVVPTLEGTSKIGFEIIYVLTAQRRLCWEV